MSDTLPRVPIRRVLTVEEADPLIGTMLTPQEPNIHDAAVYTDTDTGEPVLMYAPLESDVPALRRAVLQVPFDTTNLRGSGTRNASRTFGMATRNVVIRRESCRASRLAADNPDIHYTLIRVADDLRDMLDRHVPERVPIDTDTVDAVLPEWRMTDRALWTSGNINLSSALPYHRDRANFPTWSGMPVLRRGVRGGYLSIPEYDATIACRDGWVVFFNGNRVVHGVTPITHTSRDGYRFSIVYYALRGMKDCHTDALEQANAAARRTMREDRMASPDYDPTNLITPGLHNNASRPSFTPEGADA